MNVSPPACVLAGYVTKQQLAAEFGVHHRTVERWLDQPDGIPFVKVGGKTLFKVQSVRAWMDARERRRNSYAGAAR